MMRKVYLALFVSIIVITTVGCNKTKDVIAKKS